MYLLWSSNVDPDSINVPLGYVSWVIEGTADYNSGNKLHWSAAAGQVPTSADFTRSTDTGPPAHGLPVWTRISTNAYGGTSGSAQADGEEENQK